MNKGSGAKNEISEKNAQLWLNEIRMALAWIEAHPILLGSAAILLPSISIYHYTASKHIPLTIASPDIISSLPSVLAAIAFLVLALAAMPLIPASLMFEGTERDLDGRLRVLSRDASKPIKNGLRWLAAFFLPGFIIALGVTANALWKPEANWPITAAAIMASLGFTAMARYKRGEFLSRMLSDLTMVTLLISLLQMLIAVYAMQASLRPFGKSPTNGEVILAMTRVIVGLPLLQMLAVALVELTSRHYGFVTQAFIGALCLISAACIFPLSGSFLAGHVIGGSASGYTQCTQLKLNSHAKDFQELLVADGAQTIPLKILANASGVYLARKAADVDQVVYRIPEADVVGLTPCSSDK
jgi:hypothetical protein